MVGVRTQLVELNVVVYTYPHTHTPHTLTTHTHHTHTYTIYMSYVTRLVYFAELY